MNFFKTSRKDDIISLFYMLIYLLNDEQFLCEKEEQFLVQGNGMNQD